MVDCKVHKVSKLSRNLIIFFFNCLTKATNQNGQPTILASMQQNYKYIPSDSFVSNIFGQNWLTKNIFAD
jgi:hypothetical protein